MRLRFYAVVIIGLLTTAVLIVRLGTFVQIFYEHTGIAITQDEIMAIYSTPNSRQQYIPKIIHQVFHDWKNQSMPEDWNKVRQTCIDSNPDWEYKLWSEKMSREFIEQYYHWFLSTYDSYTYPVQRVDTVRYFLLRHYGGIYLDLDNGCLNILDPLLYYPAWITDSGRGALSNNVLGSAVEHPFWVMLTESLIPYNYNYIFPYATISYASGQWFETAIWDEYHHSLPKPDNGHENRLYRVRMDDRPSADPWIFFTQERGGTWKNWDNRLFLWIGDHLILEGFTIISLGLLSWHCVQCAWSRSQRQHIKEGYRQVQSV